MKMRGAPLALLLILGSGICAEPACLAAMSIDPPAAAPLAKSVRLVTPLGPSVDNETVEFRLAGISILSRRPVDPLAHLSSAPPVTFRAAETK